MYERHDTFGQALHQVVQEVLATLYAAIEEGWQTRLPDFRLGCFQATMSNHHAEGTMRTVIGTVAVFGGMVVIACGSLGCNSSKAFSVPPVDAASDGSNGDHASAVGGAGAQMGGGGTAGIPAGTGGTIATGGVPAQTEASGGMPALGGAAGTGLGGTALVGGAVGGAGSVSVGGATGKTGGSAGSGGNSALAGALGTGGVSSIDGGSGTCAGGCLARESCWSDSSGSRCVESSLSVPGAFAIDATEVTRGQYSAWLATNPSITGQATVCAWNTTFVPDTACMAKASVCQGSACAMHPQPCIDLCDAAAYCRAIGRSLCGDDNWTNACSSQGAYPLGYGDTFVHNACNDYTAGASTTVPVASKTACQPPASSGFTGVFDMIGNAAEWVDNCTASTGASDVCKPRGLSFGMGAAAPTCSQSTYSARSSTLDNLGFRCCTP